MVGDRCLEVNIFGGGVELFSSEGNSSFEGGGVGEIFLFNQVEASYGVAKGRATNEQSPSPVTETPVRESAWPGVTTAAAWGSGRLQHLLLL